MRKLINEFINNNQFGKLIMLLIIIVLFSAILIRGLTSGENLYEFAENNNIPIHAVDESK